MSRRGIAKLIKRVTETGSLERQSWSGRPSKVTPKIQAIVEEQMHRVDETTAVQLTKILRDLGYPSRQFYGAGYRWAGLFGAVRTAK